MGLTDNIQHASYFQQMEGKYARMEKGTANAFGDPEGYRKYVAEKRAAFEAELKKQRTAQ